LTRMRKKPLTSSRALISPIFSSSEDLSTNKWTSIILWRTKMNSQHHTLHNKTTHFSKLQFSATFWM
jgi:hypothetical protein